MNRPRGRRRRSRRTRRDRAGTRPPPGGRPARAGQVEAERGDVDGDLGRELLEGPRTPVPPLPNSPRRAPGTPSRTASCRSPRTRDERGRPAQRQPAPGDLVEPRMPVGAFSNSGPSAPPVKLVSTVLSMCLPSPSRAPPAMSSVSKQQYINETNSAARELDPSSARGPRE